VELLKRYVAASSMGAVALVCILIGLLGVTVLRPPAQQVSTVESATDLIMTRDNVLSIVKDDVTVTATSKSGAPVTLVMGTSHQAEGGIACRERNRHGEPERSECCAVRCTAP